MLYCILGNTTMDACSFCSKFCTYKLCLISKYTVVNCEIYVTNTTAYLSLTSNNAVIYQAIYIKHSSIRWSATTINRAIHPSRYTSSPYGASSTMHPLCSPYGASSLGHLCSPYGASSTSSGLHFNSMPSCPLISCIHLGSAAPPLLALLLALPSVLTACPSSSITSIIWLL